VGIPEAVRRAAFFPESDVPAWPPEHPTRRVSVKGVFVRLPAGLPIAGVSPERIDESDLEQVVHEVRRFLLAEGRTGVWIVPEAVSPPDLAERLQTLGMRPSDLPGLEARGAAMVAIQAPPPRQTDVVTRRAASFEEFLAAQRVVGDAFELDETMRRAFEERAERLWSVESANGPDATFVALLDGEIVAMAVASFGNTAVHLGGSGTRPDRRGRGAYAALVRARWDAAVERGTPALTVAAGAMSRPILEHLGFSIVGWGDCLLDGVVRPSEPDTH
jgi:GNAT superfamily N-acetyltransferase